MFIDVNAFADRGSDSAMIQAALDLANATGETVVIPKRNRRTGSDVWEIDRALRLYSGSSVLLQNAHLRLADGAICNMFTNSLARSAAALTPEGTQRDITLRGEGRAVLDGGRHNELYEPNGVARSVSKYPEHSVSENCMLYFQNVEHLVIDNLCILDQRYWGICLYTTSWSRVSNVRFISHSNVPTQDGVDLLKGCHDVIVENITGCIGDNAVALLATGDDIYDDVVTNPRDGDIHNITVRNVMVYGVGGCALTRILNHDGYRIYNVSIDNLMEVSPWSDSDASVATNPDLHILCDEKGDILPYEPLVPGERGYRCEAAIIIGESYWYSRSKAQPGDTFGIRVSNVSTHARYALFLNNTLRDSSFDGLRLFGNGHMAAYFGEGSFERVRITNVSYDLDCRPVAEDEHVLIEWNHTESRGFHCFWFSGCRVEDLVIRDVQCAGGMDSVFGGFGSGSVSVSGVRHRQIPLLWDAEGIEPET